MLRMLVCAAVLSPALVHADPNGFDESRVCREERSAAAQAARTPVPARPDDVEATARVERARSDLARAKDKQSRTVAKITLDDAIVHLENVRAEWRRKASSRELTAAALKECVARERGAFDTRAEADRAEAQRRAEESQRQADKETKERERIKSLMGHRPTLQVAISAKLCVDAGGRATALREIAAEKKYARIGGVQNMSKLYELQQDVRDYDERKVVWQRTLKQLKLKALGCKASDVKPLAVCIQQATEEPACGLPPLDEQIEAATILEMKGPAAITPEP